jgi:serine/threonine protein kinase
MLPVEGVLDGRYRLQGEIGAGGLGVVYRATHEKLDRAVAVKLLHDHCGGDAVVRGRFEREAKALAALEHPNIVAVTDFGIADDTPYLVMELLEGETLDARLTRGPLDAAEAETLATELLRVLAFVHERGLVHRDVKPSNVFLQRLADGSERLKLLDFGLAKLAIADEGAQASLTRDGSIIGTPAYMSPEQASGDQADARSDVYAVGVIVLQMLAGRLPYEGEAFDQLRSHLIAPVPSLVALNSRRLGHADLERFSARALAKRREDRFADAGEMLAALELLERPWFSGSRMGSRSSEIAATAVTMAQLPSPSNDGRPAGPQPSAASSSEPRDLAATAPVPRSRRRELRLFVLLLAVSGAYLGRERLAHLLPSFASLVLGGAPASDPPRDRAEAIPARDPASGRLGTAPASNPPSDRAETTPAHDPSSDRLAMARAPSPPPAERISDAPSGAPEASDRPGTAASVPAANGGGPLTAQPADDEPPTEATLHLQPIEQESDERAPAPAPIKSRSPARNPWRTAIPKELKGLRAIATAGARGNDHAIASLRRYNREHPGDTRGHLILASLYFNREWRADALNQYAVAYQIDPSVRGAADMLNNLIGMYARGSYGELERLIERAYRAEALPAIARALRSHRDDPRATTRLSALRARLLARSGR